MGQLNSHALFTSTITALQVVDHAAGTSCTAQRHAATLLSHLALSAVSARLSVLPEQQHGLLAAAAGVRQLSGHSVLLDQGEAWAAAKGRRRSSRAVRTFVQGKGEVGPISP